MATKVRIRRDTAAYWTSKNPVLLLAEPGLETDTGKLKFGDGSTAWNSLAYANFGLTQWKKLTTTGGTSTYTITELSGKTIHSVQYGRANLTEDEYSLSGTSFSFVGFDVEDSIKCVIAYS